MYSENDKIKINQHSIFVYKKVNVTKLRILISYIYLKKF